MLRNTYYFNKMSDLLEYFGLLNGYELRWAHAVNSRYLLRRAIEDSSVHMVEVDVSLAADGVTPICASASSSDLTLIECVDTLWGICSSSANTVIHRKGLKLDFMSSNAVIISSTLLAHYLCPPSTSSEDEKEKSPCWPPLVLHADVLSGPSPPVSSSSKKEECQPPLVISWHEILEASKRLPFASCSLGWTTGAPVFVLSGGAFNKKRTLDNGEESKIVYTDEMIKEMAEISKSFTGALTFAFRACYVVNRKDDDKWWDEIVLATFLGKKPILDEDGDVIRPVKNDSNDQAKPGKSDESEKLQSEKKEISGEDVSSCKLVPEERRNVSFLLWSHSRDDINSDLLQQFVLRQTMSTADTTERPCLLLDLNQKHMGMLDSWELATTQGIGKETMPSLIMAHVGGKYPNNKRFRYT